MIERPAQAYFSRVQLCAYLGICDTTLRDWEGRRGFPPPGRNGRWKREKVDRYMGGDEAPAPASGDEQVEEIRRAHAENAQLKPRRRQPRDPR
jgi:hypothetical protein